MYIIRVCTCVCCSDGTVHKLKAARAARKAAVERGNKLVRDAVPALKEVRRMRDEAHAQR